MKKWCLILLASCLMQSSHAQSFEVQQLLLNVEKLTQLKKILQNLKDGYQILHTGYNAIKSISEGNFNLHNLFLDGLMQVSPTVKKYKRIADIVDYQLRIVKVCKANVRDFHNYGEFTGEELKYIEGVYANLLKQSIQNLDELTMVITANKLRMSDDERLQAIDRIYEMIENQFGFLNEFTTSTSVLAVQRKNEKAELEHSRRINGKN